MDDYLQKQKQIFLQDHLFVVTANETRMLHSTLGVYTCFFVYILLYHLSLKYLCCKDPLKPYHPNKHSTGISPQKVTFNRRKCVLSTAEESRVRILEISAKPGCKLGAKKKCWWKMGTLLLVLFLFWTWLTCGILPLPISKWCKLQDQNTAPFDWHTAGTSSKLKACRVEESFVKWLQECDDQRTKHGRW